MPGASRLLKALAHHGVPAALVSASHRRIIDRVLTSLGHEHFALTVAGDEVERTKPHPDPYLLAARGLGVDPARCAVVEDTETGVTAGRRRAVRSSPCPRSRPCGPCPAGGSSPPSKRSTCPFCTA
ncbi:HAD family hydrolase [Actinomadura keratinilytica]